LLRLLRGKRRIKVDKLMTDSIDDRRVVVFAQVGLMSAVRWLLVLVLAVGWWRMLAVGYFQNNHGFCVSVL